MKTIFWIAKVKKSQTIKILKERKKLVFFQKKAENLVENLKIDSSNKENETKCVEFLKKLDTKLAIEQLPKEPLKNDNENTLLPTSNEIL